VFESALRVLKSAKTPDVRLANPDAVDGETITAEPNPTREAAAHSASVVGTVLRKCPAALHFADLLHARCGVRCLDIVDHLILPGVDFEILGWSPLGERRWRHSNSSIPDILLGEKLGFALRVDDVRQFANAVRGILSDHSTRWIGQRLRLFENSDVVVDAVDETGWHGLGAPPTTRIVRRAQLHRQLFRTRPRHFKSTEGGIEVTARMLQAAAADVGGAWASALFLCAEREYWASRCEAGYLRFRRQSQFGIGWSNVEYHSYDCSRAHLHASVQLFETLGFRRIDVLSETPSAGQDAESGRAALVMEHEALRTVVLLKVDTIAADTMKSLGQIRLCPTTWHGQSGLWCAIHGESILEGGMSHIAARYAAPAVQNFFAQEGVELLPPFSPDDLGFALQLSKGDRRAVDPRRVHALERRGYIGRDAAEDFRLNGAIATQFAIVEPSAPGLCLACSPETRLARGQVEKPHRQRHRCKRSAAQRPAART